MVNSGSIPLRTTNINNNYAKSKRKLQCRNNNINNYFTNDNSIMTTIEKITIIILMTIGLVCCKNEQEPIKCCEKDSTHALWNCGESIEYKHSELITN